MSARAHMVAGIRAEVRRMAAPSAGPDKHGIGSTAVACPHGTPLLAIATIHQDGTALTCYLGAEQVGRLANLMADFAEVAAGLLAEARH